MDTANIKRPFVTLSYAQSVDGSISLKPTKAVQLSNKQTQTLTHRLRAKHDAILIGIGTLISDDPLLTVRLVKGSNPQPIVVDSHLRFPFKARLLNENQKKPWIATTNSVYFQKERQIQEIGGRIFHMPAQENGWVDLIALLHALHSNGIRNIMVEGGARIISSFLRDELADQIVITISPVVLGGFRGFCDIIEMGVDYLPRLSHVQYKIYKDNLVFRADIIKDK